MIKTFYSKIIHLNKLKVLEIQFYISQMYFNGLNINFELFGRKTYFQLYLDIFLLKLDIDKSRRCDHQGMRISFSILNINFEFNKYDTRHWNDELDQFYSEL
jgi:hypothetical protein